MKTLVIIQARMGSTRLPGKVLMPLGKSDVLTYVVERCRAILGVMDVVVATSTLRPDDAIVKWCEQYDVNYFRGSEDDVLDRFVQCTKEYEPDYVMRVTSDCPFVDYKMATEMILQMESERKDIVILEGSLPRGLAVELISYNALLRIAEIGHELRHREHVTYYAYEYKEQFSNFTYKINDKLRFPHLRITLDTEEDYNLITEIAKNSNNVLIESTEVVDFLNKNPQVAKINSHIEQKPVI